MKIGAGDWTLLQEYTSAIANWTAQSMTLTGAAGESAVQIGFKGTNADALSAYIDDVVVMP
jgi:hypothetical protein